MTDMYERDEVPREKADAAIERVKAKFRRYLGEDCAIEITTWDTLAGTTAIDAQARRKEGRS